MERNELVDTRYCLRSILILSVVSCTGALPEVPEVESVCGDGRVSAVEECDDGNVINTDGCTQLCKLARCGDGFRRLDLAPEDQDYERCDDGNEREDDDCLTTCRPARCGDGFIQLGEEECDLGEENNGPQLACTSTCQTARCGDGLLHQGVEVCDDGNTDPTDACVDCQRPQCGDGHVWFEHEACDDGNDDDTDGCTSACALATCGDGFLRIDPGSEEGCDDGNSNDWDDCTNTCQVARCGDGSVRINQPIESDAFEECEPSESELCGEDCRWKFRLVMNRNFVQEDGEDAVRWAFRNAACYRHPDTTVWCWGENYYGQLGNPAQPNAERRVLMDSPVQVVTADGEPLTGVRDLAIASDHGCAVTEDESLYCWGSNYMGQLGSDDDYNPQRHAALVPQTFSPPIQALAVSTFVFSAWGTTCLVDGDDRVQCFGLSERQINGLPSLNLFLEPDEYPEYLDETAEVTEVPGISHAHRLVLSPTDLCVRRRDATLRCRGMNIWGSIGIRGSIGGSELDMLPQARTITTWGATADIIDLSQHVGCVRRLDGTLRCAGHTHGGLLGNNYLRSGDSAPVQPIGLTPVRQVSVGNQHVCVLQTDGEVLCWGHNTYGIIGSNYPTSDGTCWANSAMNEDEFQPGVDCYQVPQPIDAPTGTVSVASGLTSLCGVTADGRIWCRGAINAGDVDASFNNLREDRWVGIP